MSLEIGISLRGRLILIALGLVFIWFIFALLKKRKINEPIALIWLLISIGSIIVLSNNKMLLAFTHLLGAKYPASALAMIGFLFIISLLLYFTFEVSWLRSKSKDLIQHVAIQQFEYENKIKELEQKISILSSKIEQNTNKDQES